MAEEPEDIGTRGGNFKLTCRKNPFSVISERGQTDLNVCTLKMPDGTIVGKGIAKNGIVKSVAGVKRSQDAKDFIATNIINRSKEAINNTEVPLNF